MPRKLLSVSPSPSVSDLRHQAPFLTHYPRRFSVAGVRRQLPPGGLWDPTLLERLHAPVTRYRD